MTTKKEELAKQVGMNPEEADELFSEETLKSMEDNPVIDAEADPGQGFCGSGTYCATQCGCSSTPTPTQEGTQWHCGAGAYCAVQCQCSGPSPTPYPTSTPGGNTQTYCDAAYCAPQCGCNR
ncbi:MAG: hypothetical protein LBG80_15845 [Bacteroidales bacterium]|nr:hypothetical protein [Bacteroidales bacterium]